MLLFNEAYYLSENPDVSQSVEAGTYDSGEAHFMAIGYTEGRDPLPGLNSSFYLAQNPDVADANVNPLEHYNSFGENEGRAPNPLFDPVYYAQQNPDVVDAGMGLLEHFINHGASEGRFPNSTTASELASGFNETAYLAANSDIADAVSSGAFSSGYEHWSLFGYAEGRSGAQNSGGEALSVPSAAATGSLNGFVIDGKVAGATVGIDLDGDGVIGPNEPTVTTDDLGEFIFPDGTPIGPIIASGGTDISTGLPFDGRMEAPAGSTVVNPLTTVIKKMADANPDANKSEAEKAAEAQDQLKSLLGLSDINADITQVDFVTEATEGDSDGSADAVSDSDGARLYSASVQLLNIVDQGAAAIAGADGSVSAEDASTAMFASLAERLGSTAEGQTVDLGSTAGSDGDASNDAGDLLIDVIKGAAANTLSGDAAGRVDQIADSAAAIAAAANREIADRIDALEPGAAGSAIESTLVEIVKTQKVVQGDAADNIRNAAGSDNPDEAAQAISDTIAASDGSGFISDDLINDQTVGDIDGDGTVDDVPAPAPTPNPTPTPPPVNEFNDIIGTDDGETLIGTNGGDRIEALGGDDIINPGAGRDNIIAGAGNDQITLDAAGGSKHIRGDEGDDQIFRTEAATSLLRLRYDKETGGNGIVFTLVSATEATIVDTFGDTDTITYTGPTNIPFEHNLHVSGTDQDDVFSGHFGAGIDPSFQDDDFHAGFVASPRGGNDQIFGNLIEFDSISYSEDVIRVPRATGIQVSWGASGGTIIDGLGGTDTFNQNINQIEGSLLADVFISTGSYSRFRGLDGADTFDGSAGGRDIVDYRGDDDYGGMGGIFADLAAGTATDGFGNTDTLIGIERVRGSDLDGISDVLLGSGANNYLRGYRGDDTLDARGGNDIVRGGYGNDTITGGSGNDVLHGEQGNDIIIAGTGNDYITGGEGNDDITVTSGANIVIGGDGFDIVTGSSAGGSQVTMAYADEGGGQGIDVQFTSDLDAYATDTFGNIDTLHDVFQFTTTGGDDIITGPNGAEVQDRWFWIGMAGGGDDVINITSHHVTLNYEQQTYGAVGTPTQGIVVDFSSFDGNGLATIIDTHGGTDKVSYNGTGITGGVYSIVGSELADDMTGGDRWDYFVGGQGADTIRGGGGFDEVNYFYHNVSDNAGGFVGVTVDLGNQTATDQFGDTDTLIDVEIIAGTENVDSLTGDDLANTLMGRMGDDVIDGAGGVDELFGDGGDDTITTGAGMDNVHYYGSSEHGSDIVTDFLVGSDTIVMSAITQAVFDAISISDLNGSDTLIDLGFSNGVDLGQVTLLGVNYSSLTDPHADLLTLLT
ncbi:calcium-binding protein [Labrenzia sp. PHM005]|uniref:calcium-binding protein n=1 Tax=Labrenzia sp. PHM005 TaxID=2590016 RepID=UPI00113FE3B4|nr:calcium-binding protein [Labrenzia sp. PHM005]QDG76411.1 calcium-binding protein [Labrenzia sp. PHM005]